MGEITPLENFDYRTVNPLRIYKFPPKHFLTMGEAVTPHLSSPLSPQDKPTN